jgi:hypothetical protein
MMSEGPVMRRFRAQPKMSFESESGLFRVKLPVEPGTKLAQDFAGEKATEIGDASRAAGHAVVVTMGDHCLGIARTARSGEQRRYPEETAPEHRKTVTFFDNSLFSPSCAPTARLICSIKT